MRRFALAGLAVVAAWLPASAAPAATLPAGFSDTAVTTVPQPTAFAFTPSGRLLITTKTGQLRVFQNGALLPTPALDLAARLCAEEERGLLGVAVDPEFASNGYVYLYYTAKKYGTCAQAAPPNGPVNRVSRFVLGTGNAIDPSSERILIDGIPSRGGNHNGGQLQFGKDNQLYVSVGDGGCDYAEDSGCGGSNDAARDRHVLLGKVLRISGSGGIPGDNPFRGTGSARCNASGHTDPGKVCQETWAWGLRNPFRLGFDPNAEGTRVFINDVGETSWEEVDAGSAGADYGWNLREGHCPVNSTTNCGPPPAGVTNPIYAYPHSDGCGAITGGAFVPNGVWPPAYDGRYLFGDYNCGEIKSLRSTALGWAAADFGDGLGAVIDLGFGPWGPSRALYYVTWTSAEQGELRRIAYTGNRSPDAAVSASPTSGGTPLGVFFEGDASSDPDGDALRYDWDFGDGSAHSATANPGHVYRTAGTYLAFVKVTDPHGASAIEGVRVDVGNTPPLPSIQSPTASARFRVGQRIVLQGSAGDPQDGALGAGRLSWTVVLHHNFHIHPFLGPTAGNDIAFDAPPPEDLNAAATSYLEVKLTATDSKGLSTTVSRDLRPRTVDLRFETAPSGRSLTVDGIPVTAPRSFSSWEGYSFTVDAPSPQNGPGKLFLFSSWSDGGAARHTVTTGASAQTFSARFSETKCGGGVMFGGLLVLLGALAGRRFAR